MADSVVRKFDDPSSYEFVSLRSDTFRGADYIKNIRSLYVDTILTSKEKNADEQKLADNLEKRPGYLDSIIDIQIVVNFRGRNKLGALILNHLRLNYYPVENIFTIPPQ